MSVRRRGKRLVVDYYPDGRKGKRVQISLPPIIQDEDQARALEKDMKAAAKGEEQAAVVHQGTIVQVLFEEYLEWCRTYRRPRTQRDIENAWSSRGKKILGQERILDINKHHLNVYSRIRRADGVSNRTVTKELAYFSGFLKWCRREKNVPLDRIRIEPLPHKRPLPMVLSPEEAVQLVEHAPSSMYRALFCALYTLGLRISEARGLTWGDVDMTNHVLKVTQKGGSQKILPMGGWLEGCLREIRRRRPADSPVFVNHRTGKPFYDVRKAMEKARAAAKIQKKVTPHLLRHSIATHMVGQDVNLRTVQQYLGHAQVVTTEWYTHVAMGHLRKAADTVLSGIVTTGISRKGRKKEGEKNRHHTDQAGTRMNTGGRKDF